MTSETFLLVKGQYISWHFMHSYLSKGNTYHDISCIPTGYRTMHISRHFIPLSCQRAIHISWHFMHSYLSKGNTYHDISFLFLVKGQHTYHDISCIPTCQRAIHIMTFHALLLVTGQYISWHLMHSYLSKGNAHIMTFHVLLLVTGQFTYHDISCTLTGYRTVVYITTFHSSYLLQDNAHITTFHALLLVTGPWTRKRNEMSWYIALGQERGMKCRDMCIALWQVGVHEMSWYVHCPLKSKNAWNVVICGQYISRHFIPLSCQRAMHISWHAHDYCLLIQNVKSSVCIRSLDIEEVFFVFFLSKNKN